MVANACPTCNATVHPKARLCLSCGATLAQTGGRWLWRLVMVGSVLGGLIVLLGVPLAASAPQEAAAAAIGVACAVIPYCLARAADERRR